MFLFILTIKLKFDFQIMLPFLCRFFAVSLPSKNQLKKSNEFLKKLKIM